MVCLVLGLVVGELDVGGVAAEIGGVEGEEAAFAVGEHGGDDVGVVDLASADGDFAAEGQESLRDSGSVFENLEAVEQPAGAGQRLFACERNEPGLWTGEDSQVLADNLTADAKRFAVANGLPQTRPGDRVVRGLADAGVDEDVGVDEHGGLEAILVEVLASETEVFRPGARAVHR